MKRFIALLLPALIALASCTFDESGSKVTLGAGEALASFTVNVPELYSGPSSYGIDIADENGVSAFHVFAFGSDGKLADYAKHNQITGSGSTPSFNVRFKKLTVGQNYTFVVLANAETQYEALTSYYTADATRADLMKRFIKADGSGTTISSIPMWGEISVTNLQKTHNVPSFSLLRMMSKINVEVATTPQSKFELTSVRFYNYYTDGYIAPTATVTGNKVSAPSLTGTDRVIGSPVIYNVAAADKYNFKDKLYAFEADVPVAAGEVGLDKVHCLVIGGKYNGAGTPTYYRLNITDQNGEYLPLLRNYSYNLKITDVSSSGYTDPGDAFGTGSMSNIEASIITWNHANTVIEFDGQNYLSVTKKSYVFGNGKRDANSTDNIINITTDAVGGWKVLNNSGYFKLSAASGSNGDYRILCEANGGSSDITGTLTIVAGRVQSVIDITQKPTPDITPVTGIDNISTTSITLTEGQETALPTITFSPAGATAESIDWKSSDDKVFKVENGKVVAIGPGTATLTVIVDGKYIKTCQVTINSSTVSVTGVTISKTSTILIEGATEQLTANVVPSNATIQDVTWSSSAPAVASVSSTGFVTALTAGETTITVKTTDGNYTKTCVVTVNPLIVSVTHVDLNKTTLELSTSDTGETLIATVKPDNATNKSILKWESSNEGVATVTSAGFVQPAGGGTATITVTTEDGNKTASCEVTVIAADGSTGTVKGANGTYSTYTYGNVEWMVTNSMEGTGSGKAYGLNWSGGNVGTLNTGSRGTLNGYYYTHAQAKNACPSGWSLPTQAQFNALMTIVNNDKTGAGKWWTVAANGAFAGYYLISDSVWNYWGSLGSWWSSTSNQYYYASTGGMYGPNTSTNHWFSVRCVKN